VTPAPAFDDVDRIAADWHRERPDLDLSPLQVLSRVSRLGRHLDQARRQAFAAHSLEAWEFDVLAALRRAGEPYALSPGHLGAETLVTSGTMTNRIDRLEQRGLVRREPDAVDRRSIRVILTAAGRSCVDGALSDLLIREHGLLSGLSAQEQSALSDLLRLLVRAFDTPD
jgi:DNA-binding MarR family transcriptional regulator